MMRIILLLLVILAGPFCTFTQASTLVVPTSIDTTTESNLLSEPPVVTDKSEETSPQYAISTTAPAPKATEASASTKVVPVVSTVASVIQSETPLGTTTLTDTTQTTEAGTSEKASHEAPTVTSAELEKSAVTQSETSTVMIDNEGHSTGTGQLAGIVIGALIAVIVVIAVIILVVRRMGQYSIAKKRKPQKQASILISPLKRKARQEEKKKKFGKF